MTAMTGPAATQDVANKIAVARPFIILVGSCLCSFCCSHTEAAKARIAQLQASLAQSVEKPPVPGYKV